MPSTEKAEFEEDARKVEEKKARSVKVRKKPVCKLFRKKRTPQGNSL